MAGSGLFNIQGNIATAGNPFLNALSAASPGLLNAAANIDPSQQYLARAMQPAWGAFGQGMQVARENRRQDMQDAQRQQEMGAQEALKQKYISMFMDMGKQDYARLIEGGMAPGDAYRQFMADRAAGGAAKPMEVNGQLVDPTTYQVLGDYRTKDSEKPTSDIQNYQFYAEQERAAGRTPLPYGEFKQQIARAGASNINMNNEQANAATYADRMANADRILNDPKIVGAMTDVVQKGFSEVPVVGNFMTSENRKLADQAKRDFINAVLRKESGAAISPSEFANAEQQYFPQPGDTPDVIEQKAANRKIAIQGISRAAGPAYQQPSLDPLGIR